MSPSLVEAGMALAEAGCQQVDVVPLFLGAGGHVRKDLPALLAQLQAAHPTVIWRLNPAVGESPTVVEAMQNTYTSGPLFSADSNHVLFARVDDVNTFNAQLIAAGPSGTLALGDPSLWTHDRLDGARIAFNDNVAFNSRDFFSSTADLKWVDLSSPSQTLTTIAPRAYLTFLPSGNGKDLVFTTKRGSQGPGLYVAKRRG